MSTFATSLKKGEERGTKTLADVAKVKRSDTGQVLKEAGL
jgi:hypothetical protein